MNHLFREQYECDVCVVGGGMAGLCAAIASARGGAKTVLIHDRPVLGGNASSEVRMWVCGAHGKNNKETGILEEVQLENLYHNAGRNYSVWDSVLWANAHFQPNLTLLLNASCTDAETSGSADAARIVSVTAWQSPSQTWHTVHAKQFVDCSGDSILAAVTPALFRVGREARFEFDEDIEPETGDRKTMGNSCLIQMRRTEEAQPFTAPSWAYKFTSPDDLPHRMRGVNGNNFWWIELGGLNDTIKDAEAIRDELTRVCYGVWDYIKNHAPERAQSENWALEWVGSLPGKRESRRYIGDHVLTQNDIRSGGDFADIIAYGGWSMDDHHPAGLLYPGKPTVFHPAPSPYGIPYRCLYSRNVENLLFAGRNISVTHAALSSTRVMATCALIGQAAGTAAALCVRGGILPRSLSVGTGLQTLQKTLMDDDCWLPGKARPVGDLARAATLTEGNAHGAHYLLDGVDRDRENEPHAFTGTVGTACATFQWREPVNIAGARLVFDSDLSNDKRMPYIYPQKVGKHAVPGSLVRGFRLEAQSADDGTWETAFRATDNRQRLVTVAVDRQAVALRLVVESTWGGGDARVFACEPQAVGDFAERIPPVPDGVHFSAIRAGVPPEDLLPPPDRSAEPMGKRGVAA